MSNVWKAGRVTHIFGVQLRDRTVTEQSCFHCFLTAVRFIPVSVFNFYKMITLGLVTFSWLCFQMNVDNYPYVTIAEDGSLCSTGQHRPGFPRVLYDVLRQLGYNGDAPVYRGRMSMAHGQDKCEVNVVIPLNPTEPWMATVIRVELDETIEQTAQVTHSPPCVRPASPTLPRCQSRSFRSITKRILCGSITLRPCPTPRGPTSMPAWLHWPGTRNTCLTYRPALAGPSCGSICT
jgi:hypothetical protein